MTPDVPLEVKISLILDRNRDSVRWVALRVTPSNPNDVSTRGDLEPTLQRVGNKPEECSEVPCSGPTNAPAARLEPFREPTAREDAGTKAVCECTEALAAWIFQVSPEFSNVRSAVRSLDEAVWLVRQFKEEIKLGDTAYLWLSGRRGGIIGVAEVLETPRIQPEPREQIPFIRKTEKFAGDQLRVKLRLLKRIQPVIPRTYLRSRTELSKLSILRCPRGTNFRVSREEAEILKTLVASHMAAPLVRNAAGSGKRVIFVEE
jgi:hypothetical protein